jgi:hypothetical protein
MVSTTFTKLNLRHSIDSLAEMLIKAPAQDFVFPPWSVPHASQSAASMGMPPTYRPTRVGMSSCFQLSHKLRLDKTERRRPCAPCNSLPVYKIWFSNLFH